jgi:hypothetical protein
MLMMALFEIVVLRQGKFGPAAYGLKGWVVKLNHVEKSCNLALQTFAAFCPYMIELPLLKVMGRDVS